MSIALAISLIIGVLVAAYLKGEGVKKSKNSVFAGVCAGIAKRYGWDVTVVRIITLICACTLAGPVTAYILLYFILDDEA